MLVSEEAVTVSCVAPRKTLGVSLPRWSPLMVIAFPCVFSVTLRIELGWAVRTAGIARTTAARIVRKFIIGS
jgi:hypothetical protein